MAVTDPAEQDRIVGSGTGWPDGGAAAAEGSPGFAVPAQPPMPGYSPPGSPPPGFAAPVQVPPGYAPPGYAQQGFAQPGYPPGYPSPGYPAAGYPPGYPPPGNPYQGWAPPRGVRPGTVTGPAVLAFVTAGLDIIGGIIMISLVQDYVLVSGWHAVSLWWIAVILSLVCGGLLIAGGVVMLQGRPTMIFVGGAGTALVAVYWGVLALQRGTLFDRGFSTYPLTYLALAVVMVGLALSPSARAWCASHGAGRWNR